MKQFLVVSFVAVFICACATLKKSSVFLTSLDGSTATIADIHDALLSGRTTCRQIISQTLDRIKAYNLSTTDKSVLNAIVYLNPRAFEIADELDRYFSQNGVLKGPLHCVSVAVKDNIDTYDMPTSSGSLSLLGSQPNFDAATLKKMRNAGAVILLKATMDEFASGMRGESSLSGRTGNLFDPTQNAGGSSGGSAVAVAAGFAQVALGSDNSGSVRIPAAFNGVWGLRPGRHVIDSQGVFPRGALDAELGPMARSIEDLQKVFAVISTTKNNGTSTSTLDGIIFGVVEEIAGTSLYEKVNAQAKTRYEDFLQLLIRAGATIKRINFPHFDIDRKHNMAGEVEDINNYLASFPGARADYQDICRSNREEAFGNVKQCLTHLKETKSKKSMAYAQVNIRFDRNRRYVEARMSEEHVDILLSPISFNGEPTNDPYQVLTWQLPLSSNAGLPSLSVIISRAAGAMPFFMEALSKSGGEEMLLHVGKQIETLMNLPHLKIEALRSPDTLLMDFDIAQLNNLYATIGWQAFSWRQEHKDKGLIDPRWFSALVLKIINEHRVRLKAH